MDRCEECGKERSDVQERVVETKKNNEVLITTKVRIRQLCGECQQKLGLLTGKESEPIKGFDE